MPTAEQIQSAVDSRVDELRAWISATQESYLSVQGRYASLGWSHSNDPADGVVASADRLDVRLPHQAETWSDFGYPITEPVCNASIDEYIMPNGTRGWVLNLRLVVGGITWLRRYDGGSGGFGTQWLAVGD